LWSNQSWRVGYAFVVISRARREPAVIDRYASFAASGAGRFVVKRLGLPDPPRLRRHHEGARQLAGAVLLGGGGRLTEPIAAVLARLDADVRRPTVTAPGAQETAAPVTAGLPDSTAAGPSHATRVVGRAAVSESPATVGTAVMDDLPAAPANGVMAPPTAGSAATAADGEPEPAMAGRFGALIFDATDIRSPDQLLEAYAFFHPYARSLVACGRVIVFGTPPDAITSSDEAIAQRALEGLTRSIGKEFGHGTTAQLVYVAPGAESRIESTLRFLLSGKSAYVSGQVIHIGAAGKPATDPELWNWDQPLFGKVALVTGAARGIGAAIAEVLARDGATVVCLDVPGSGDALGEVANRLGGVACQLDLTDADAPTRLVTFLRDRYGRVDIVVHNAGVTRDKTLANMTSDKWQTVIAVNLIAPKRVDDALVDADLLPPGSRIIGISSVAGIAGNRGQTNYATSKAGVIGLVEASAGALTARGVTINAVAPGFIETAMTASMPLMLREAGRRLNSMAQGGLPIDVAETVAWIASPASDGLTGNVVRVCGQSLLGA